MKKLFALVLLWSCISLSSEQESFEVQWIWRNDPFYDKYKRPKDFGLKVSDNKFVYRPLYGSEKDEQYRHPIRLTTDGWVDLSQKFRVSEMSRFVSSVVPSYSNPKASQFMNEWTMQYIYIVKVHKDDEEPIENGFFVNFGNEYSDKGPYFVWAPTLKGIAEGEEFKWLIKRSGTFDYLEYGTEERTIRRYEYGVVPLGAKLFEKAKEWLKEKYQKTEGEALK